MWPHYVIKLKTRSWEYRLVPQVWNYLDAGLFEDKMCFIFLWVNFFLFFKKKKESWQWLRNCVESPNTFVDVNAATPTHSMWYARSPPAKWLYFSHSKLTRRPWHRRFGAVQSGGESESDPARSVCFRLWSYSCFHSSVMQRGEKGWGQRNWEVFRKREGKKEKRTRERKSRQPWFSVTPPQASCAIFNTQAHVLPNLSRPGFCHNTSPCALLFWRTWCTWFADTSDWQSVTTATC